MFIGKIDSFGIFDLTDLFKRNKKSRTRCRKVEMFEFEYIVSDGGITVINDKKYCLSPNTFILRKPGQKSYSLRPFKCQYFHIAIDRGGEYFKVLKSLPDFFPLTDGTNCRNIMESLILHLTNNGVDPYCYYTNAKLLELFYLLSNCADLKHETNAGFYAPARLESVKKTVEYIKNHCEEPIKLKDLASLTGYSPNYFHSVFSAATGITPQQFIMNERLKKAKRLLATTQKSMLEISCECGYSSQSYFTEQFKNVMLLTPGEYRKMLTAQYAVPFKNQL